MLAIFNLVPGFVWAIGMALALAWGGIAQLRLVNLQLEAQKERLEQEEQARARENELRKNVDKVIANDAHRQDVLQKRVADAQRAVAGMRDTISAIDARPDPGPTAATDEARAARELLGACTEEYRAVATDADQLRNQVTGLQEYGNSVSKQ